ncbi:MAG TPA: hypothetical protein DCE52_05605 [Rhodobacteraceae bacterium]|nr:hypothetical protein [Paracoccaceae bacterium]
MGYYALAQSKLNEQGISAYKTFWTTEVGIAIDNAFFSVVRTSYEILSFGLGQAVAFWFPQMKSKQLCGLT